ncbi:hypothetical protein [Streptomyces sp. NPDC001678]|uniref:hypothetical protein n=1 Tax=Streptomyces sp. NPDC001678 TaxID=3364599 RepID=UPI0036AC4FBB
MTCLFVLDLSDLRINRNGPERSRGNVIHTTLKGLAAAGCVALVAAASVACDPTDKLSPEAKVERAFDKLGGQQAVSADFGFDAGADKLYEAMKGEDDFQRSDAETLANLKLSFAISNDKPLKDVKPGDKNGAVTFKLAKKDSDKPLVEFRGVSQKLYLRGDLKALAEFGEKSEKSKSAKGAKGKQALDELLKKADQLPPSLDAVKGAVKGDWVSLDTKSFEEFGKSFGKDKGASGNGSLSDSLDPATQKQALEAMRKALMENAKFADADSKGGADHVKVTANAKTVGKKVVEGLKPLKDKLGSKRFDKLSKWEDAPDKDVTVDVAIKDGMLSGLSFDAAKLDKDAKGELPVTIGFKGGSEKVEAPAGAKELKPQDLMGAAMFVFMGDAKNGGAKSPFGSDANSPFGGGSFGGGAQDPFSKSV